MKNKSTKRIAILAAITMCLSAGIESVGAENTNTVNMEIESGENVEAEPVEGVDEEHPKATNDYTKWKQYSSNWYEETPWPEGRRFGAAGCWVTSFAMMLRHHNIVTEEDVNVFNPIICNNHLMDCGVILNTGDYLNAGVEKIYNAYPGLYYVADVPYSFEKLKELYDEGFMCIVHETRGHYVAVKDVTEDEVHIMDPGYRENQLTDSNFIQYFSTDPVYTVKGKVDRIVMENGLLVVEGWSYDLQDPEQYVTIAVTVGAPLGQDGVLMSYGAPAQKEREDLAVAFPEAGMNHAFSFRLKPTVTGEQPVYVYALTLGDQAKARLLYQQNVWLG